MIVHDIKKAPLPQGIDYIFRRRKYDYQKVLDEISQKIGSGLDINKIISRIFKELKEILHTRNSIILIQEPGETDYKEAANTGYEKLTGREKKGNCILKEDNPLSRCLNRKQKALEKE